MHGGKETLVGEAQETISNIQNATLPSDQLLPKSLSQGSISDPLACMSSHI